MGRRLGAIMPALVANLSRKMLMRIPDRFQAELWLQEAGVLNPGPWVAHSRYVAEAARNIATHLPALDPEIGLRAGPPARHRAAGGGYRHAAQPGWLHSSWQRRDARTLARVCLTHFFQSRDVRETFGERDCTPEEMAFIEDYLAQIEYNDYDRLIHLCDSLANATGFCLMEKRMLDVGFRYGINDHSLRSGRPRSTSRPTLSGAWDVQCTACCRAWLRIPLASRLAELRPAS